MKFHYLTRGIIIVNGKLLLAHQKGADNTFLPGGHIENGEKVQTALIREIKEEIGYTAIVKQFVGAVEHTWSENNHENYEINLIFEVAVPDLDSRTSPESLEAHLEFIWSDIESLEVHNLRPFPLIECLKSFEKLYKGYWGTSLIEKA